MRRILSLALIALILFKTVGYYCFLAGMQYHNERKLISTFDSGGEGSLQTFSLKIPIPIPYLTGSQEYERIDGIFEHEGEFLRFVKQRYYKDTLEIICIRDVEHKKINQALVTYANSFTNKAGSGPVSKVFQPIKEFLNTAILISAAAAGWRMQILAPPVEESLSYPYTPAVSHPPEYLLCLS